MTQPTQPPTKPHRTQSRWLTLIAALGALITVGVVIAGTTAQSRVTESTAAKDSAAARATTLQAVATSAVDKAAQGRLLADQLTALCTTAGPAHDALVSAGVCQQAATVREVPGPTGPPGEPGAPGRGVVGTYIANGHLFIVYSDGTSRDLGQVVGAAGADGATGPGGPAGRSVTGTRIDPGSGDLLVTYSDRTTVDVGHVVGATGPTGPTGPQGPTGPAGTNGTNGAAGPTGPKGDPGQPPAGWTYTDKVGATHTCTPAPNSTPSAPTYQCS